MADSKVGVESVTEHDTDLEALLDVEVEITAILGSTMMDISQVLKLGRGAVVELNRTVGEDIEVKANNRVVALGEVVVVEERLGVSLTSLVVLAGVDTENTLAEAFDTPQELPAE